MVSNELERYGSAQSAIRALYEYGMKRAREVGPESVYDFSIGNPSVPAPKQVDDFIREILATMPTKQVHGYTSTPGSLEFRRAVAENTNRHYGTHYGPEAVYSTYGASQALTLLMRALTPDDGKTTFLAFAPYFPGYTTYAHIGGGCLKVVPPDVPNFQIDFDKTESMLTPDVQGVLIDNPNNPTGVVFGEGTIKRLANLLRAKSAEFDHPIYLISDEPYREMAYDGVRVPFLPAFYDDTIICYSYSKSLSLPGERIGYILMPDSLTDYTSVRRAVFGAAQLLGANAAPSLMQYVVARCMNSDVVPDLKPYLKNRELLCRELGRMGYHFVKPEGAFYMFVEAPGGNAQAFFDRAKAEGVLIVPGDTFGCEGWVRVSYCVDYDMIVRALPLFEKLINAEKLAAC